MGYTAEQHQKAWLRKARAELRKAGIDPENHERNLLNWYVCNVHLTKVAGLAKQEEE